MRAAVVVLALVVLALAACGGKNARSAADADESRSTSTKKTGALAPVTGRVVAQIGERTLGPFLARRGEGPRAPSMVAWVTQAEGSGRRVMVVPLDGQGAPRGTERTIARVPIDTTTLVVRPLRGATPGFVVAWTQLVDRGESLWAMAVDDAGNPRANGVELVRTGDDIVWVDVVPTDLGATCFWAEETRSGDANLVAASLNAEAKVRGAPTRVARGVVGWHALEVPGGVAVSTIAAAFGNTAKPAHGPEERSGALSVARLDPDAHPIGAPTIITPKPIVSGDLEVARMRGRIVFGWTDRSAEEPTIVGAAMDDSGGVEPPRTMVEARGGAVLVGLAGGGAGAAVMYESPARRQGDSRRLHVARIGNALAAEGRPLSFEVFGRASAELAATSSGFAVIGAMRDCELGSPACANAKVVATTLRTDASATILQREPLDFNGDPASLGWGMTCDREACFALAATPGTPSRVRAAHIRPRVNTKPPGEPPPKEGPQVVDVTAISAGDSVLDLAATRMGDATLVAMLASKRDTAKRDPKTDKTDGPKGETPKADTSKSDTPKAGASKPAIAGRPKSSGGREHEVVLSTRLVDANGAATPPAVISNRALSVGGVAVAVAEKAEDGAAVAWVARDNGDAEVHVTRLDRKGKKTNEIQLTTTKGDATDVTITWAAGGWVVAWIDGRDQNGEVYATRLSPELQRGGREERLTNAPGDASDLVALAQGDFVWLAWADPRESPKDGIADVFVTAVKGRDAKRALDEQRLLATAAHSRTPQLAAASDGVHVGWIEEAPMGSETPASSGYGALWTTIDGRGKPVSKPARIPLAGDGAATSVALETTPSGLRSVIARANQDGIALDAVDLGVPSPRPSGLLLLDGPPSLDVALVLHDGVAYFNDDGPRPMDKRARRARIAWAPR